jgi:tetraacyldisaccharide 4'-kinase
MTPRRTTTRRVLDGWGEGFSPAAARAMTVVAAGYRAGLGARDWLYRRGVLRSRAVAPVVVSIGNLTVGGTGKTPATELAALTLASLGRRPAIVSRGYRRRSRGVQIVADTASIRLDPEDAGDEPFLLARRLPGVPVIVGANRHEAACVAVERFGVNAIVLDDGFQHRTLEKDLEIVMVRADEPWGNGRLLPSGPLREPLAALVRADLVVATGVTRDADADAVRLGVARHAARVPVLAAVYTPAECWRAGRMEPLPLARLAGLRVLAFSGVGSPAGFERTLTQLGAILDDVVVFDDHHWYSGADLDDLAARAARRGVDALVTTEKDWVRLRALPLPARPLYVVSIRLDLVTGEPAWRSAFERACRKG